MPYDRIDQLPQSLRERLPERALEVYRRAFNRAWARTVDPAARDGATTREEMAHRAALAEARQAAGRTGKE